MISIEKKFLFIHYPKTGGNSIQEILHPYAEDQMVKTKEGHDLIERFEIRNDKYKIRKHSSLKEYKKEIEPAIFKTLYKFSVIRNPWDRMISYYFSPHRNQKKQKDWNKKDFIKLIQRLPTLKDFLTTGSLGKKINQKTGLNLLPLQQKNLDSEINFIIRFEQMEEDFKLVCDKLDIPYTPLPHRNKSKRSHYTDYYDEALIELVRNKFIDEVEFGNYKFDSK